MSADGVLLIAEIRLRAQLEAMAIDAELLRARIDGTQRILDAASEPTTFGRLDYRAWERALQRLDQAIQALGSYGGAFVRAEHERLDSLWRGLRDVNARLYSSRDDASALQLETLERLMTAAFDVVCSRLLSIAAGLARTGADGATTVRTHVAKAYEALAAPGRDAERAAMDWFYQSGRPPGMTEKDPRTTREQMTPTEQEVDRLAWLVAASRRRLVTTPSDVEQAREIVARRNASMRPAPPTATPRSTAVRR